MNTRQFGNPLFTMRKQYGMIIFWFFFPGLFNLFLINDWLDNGNIIGLVFALIIWLPAFYVLADRIRSRIFVHEKGLIVQSLLGTKTVKFTPALQMYIGRIQERVYGMNTARHVSMRLVQNKEEIKIPSTFLYMEELIDVLLNYQSQTMLPAIMQAFNDGKTLNFGAIKLSNKMIAVKDKKFPFAELREIEVENGVLRLYTHTNSGGLLQKGAAFVQLSKIANFDVLNHLLSGSQPNAKDDVKIY